MLFSSSLCGIKLPKLDTKALNTHTPITIVSYFIAPLESLVKYCAVADTSPDCRVNFIFCDSSVYPFWAREIITTADNPMVHKGSIVWYPWDTPSENTCFITGVWLKSPRGDTIPTIIK